MKRGFTLFEMVAALVLLGITGALAGLMLTSTVERYNLERDAAAMNQKVENAMARIIKELTWAVPGSVIIENSGRTLRWESRHPARAGEGEQELTWSGVAGDPLLLEGAELLDRVDSFFIPDTLGAGHVDVQLQPAVHSGVKQTRVYLRDDI